MRIEVSTDVRTRYDVEHHHADGTAVRMAAEAPDIIERLSAEVTTSRNDLHCECGHTVSFFSTTNVETTTDYDPGEYAALASAAMVGHTPADHMWVRQEHPDCALCAALDRIVDAAPTS